MELMCYRFRTKMAMTVLFRIILLTFLSTINLLLLAQNRYWVAAAPANWSGDNWSSTSGGAADGSGPPSGAANARFDANGLGNCTVDVLDPNISGLILNGFTGVIDLNGNTVTTSGTVTLTTGTINDTPGTDSLVINSTGTASFNGTTFGAIVHVTATHPRLNGSTFNARFTAIKNGGGGSTGSGGNTFNSSAYFTHSGASGNWIFAGTNPDDYNGQTTYSNIGSGTIYLSQTATGNTFDGNIILNTNSGNGIIFGNNNGTTTLGNTYTITIGGLGFSSGTLRLRNFTQTSATGQNLTLTGTGNLDIYDALWEGDVVFSSPRITTRGTSFLGTANLTKTGASGDNSAGGNRFTGNTAITMTGSGSFSLGYTNPDTCDANLSLINTGSNHMYFASTGLNHVVSGNLEITNSPTGAGNYSYIGNNASSSLTVGGNVTILNNGSASDSRVLLADDGDVSIGGNLNITNSGTGAASYVQVANNTDASVQVTGNTTISNSGSLTTKRVYFGNNGDVTLTGTLEITNASDANNSEVYLNHNANSANTYNDDITINVTNASADGIYFGNSGGSSTLVATKTLSIGGGGFLGTNLYLRNFSQIGATAQTLAPAGTTTTTIYDCNWGGNVSFTSSRIYLRGTTFSGTASFRKTGAGDDQSAGGNTFTSDVNVFNSGSGYFMFGNGSPDTFGGNLTLQNTGTNHIYIAYNSAGNTIAGNLNGTNSGTGNSYLIFSGVAGSDLTITGTSTLINSGNGINNNIYFGDNGSIMANNDVSISNSSSGTNSSIVIGNNTPSLIDITGNLIVNNTSTASNSSQSYVGNSGDINVSGTFTGTQASSSSSSNFYMANSSNSVVSIGGNTSFSNSGGNTTKRVYLGNSGNVIFNGTVSLTNSSTATNSELYLNHNLTSNNTYNENIILEATNASADGIYFGNSGGSSTLAATKTISIAGGGFIGRNLFLRNFTQTGATNQSLAPTGTAYLTIYDCSWGGDIHFSSPQIITRGTTYSGITTLSKTGASNNNSDGGNTFTGATILNNSGSGQFLMGNVSADTFGSDLTLNNTGSSHMYLAHNSAGNSLAGNFVSNNSGTGTSYIYLSTNTASTLDINGTATINNTGSGTDVRTYIGENGDINFLSTLELFNTATSTTGQIQLANSANSTVSVAGAVNALNNSVSTNSRIYLGNSGDALFGDNLSITNSSNSTTTEFYLASATSSTVSVSGNTSLINSGAGTSCRAYLGNSGSVTFDGTLTIENSSGSNNSQVYCNNNLTSSNIYNDNIIIENSHVNGDGILFGNSGGSGTLAATKTISIGAGGFVAGSLTLRDFTQVGATAQTLEPTGTTNTIIYDSNWGGDVVFSSPRISTRGTTYSGTVSLSKTGASDDRSYGGNTFTGNTILNNSGSDFFLFGDGNSDTFGSDLTLNNTGTDNMYCGYSSAGNSIGGDLTINNSGAGNNNVFISDLTISTFTISGLVTINNNGSGSSSNVYLGDDGDLTLTGALTATNNPTSTSGQVYVANGTNSAVTIGGNTIILNDEGSTTKRVYLGNNGDITFSGTLSITNNSSATNSEVFCNQTSNSNNSYNENILLEVTHANSDGIYFGNSLGSGTLAATKTISINGGGFIAGYLTIRNFTQIGATAQTLEPTGSTIMNIYDSNWGGDVVFSSPRILTRGTTYSGAASLEKTGAVDESSYGGNTFVSNATITNSGSGYWRFGNTAADVFGADVTLNNSGTRHLYFAYNGLGHSIAGNLTANNTVTGTGTLYIGSSSTSSLDIVGSVNLVNNCSGPNCNTYLGDNADITIGGDLSSVNTASGAAGEVRIANNSNSLVTISGNTTINNSGSGTTKRTYLSNEGDIVFNGTLDIINSSSANNSQVYCNYGSNSFNAYNENISLESTHASCDGILFGSNTGSGTLAATKTISIGGGGFVAGLLTLRNFTQVGATAQTLEPTGSAWLNIYNSSWGGDVIFSSPRISTRGTTYSGTANLEKTGAIDDFAEGGNTFTGNATITNSGSGYWRFGNSTFDDFNSNVTLNNTGTYHLYFAYNGLGHTIAGDLTANNSVTGNGTIYIGNATTSSLDIGGSVSILNNCSGASCNTYLGNNGDITVGGDVNTTNSASGNAGEVRIASGTNSSVNIIGNTTINNSGAGTTKRTYLGYDGDVIFNGTLDIINSSSATNSQVYSSYNASSINTYSENISVESTHASCDGVLFGSNNGSGTLAATKTITIGGGGFIAGELRLRNFTQVGATPQALLATGTTLTYIYNSSFGGDVTFSSPRINTRGTSYSGTALLTKTGATDDASVGGNTFTGETILNNSGSGYFLMGNGSPDIFSSDLTLNNSGSRHMYIAHNSAGNTIGGNFEVNNDGTGTSYIYISTSTASTLNIAGTSIFNNTGTGANCRMYIGDDGDIDFSDNVTITNNTAGTSSYIYMGDGTQSTISIAGNTILNHNGAGSTHIVYLGNNGDLTFNGNLTLTNASSASNSQFYINNGSNSSNIYNGNISLEVTSASSDGFYFGNSGGSGTLSDGNTISIGGAGFIAGYLSFINFTQIGSTAQSLTTTGSSLTTIRNSSWGGNVSFTSPRMFTRESNYNGTSSFTKTSNGNDDSYGGNTFVGDATFTHNGSNRFRLAATIADNFNADANYIQTSGTLSPAYNGMNTYSGNINFNTTSSITMASSNGMVVLNGTTPQSINDLASTAEPTIRRLQLNNTIDEVTLNTPITISTLMTFTAGNMNTTDANLLTLNDNISVSGTSDDSYVYGPVEKIGNDAFEFPVGDSGLFRPISISAPSSGSSRFRASYHEVNPDSASYTRTSLAGSLDHVSSSEYWELERTNGTNSVFVTLSWDSNSGTVDDLSELRVAHYNGGIWLDEGSGSTSGNTSTGSITSANALSSFSPFTLSSTTENNALPIELKLFEAEAINSFVELSWITSSEINNDYFNIERSRDGIKYESIAKIDGAGNSNNELNYSIVDSEPLSGISYYRLKQTDFDGKFEYSDWKSVKLESQSKNDFKLYPNPISNEELNIEIELVNNSKLKVEVFNKSGVLILYKDYLPTNNNLRFKIPEVSNLKSGIYLIRFVQQGELLSTKKFIVR